jgi:DMSO/TMAO reductase YedYZ molybdopterin-dependent catalytic subunit
VRVSRGFTGRHRGTEPGRLPPGQYDVGSDWPVLTAELTPRVDLDSWSITVNGQVESPQTWTWKQVQQLPPDRFDGDIHCVTTWSKLDTSFAGISVDTLLAAATPSPEATFAVATSTTGYTTNLPIEDITGGKAWIVWEHEGRPLPVEHGGPVRMIVPHLYFWKSAKWIETLTLLNHDEPGFWEVRGYHDRGDPWREQRYQGD